MHGPLIAWVKPETLLGPEKFNPHPGGRMILRHAPTTDGNLYTYINHKTTQESRSLDSDLESFQAQQLSTAYGLCLGLGIGVGCEIV